MIRDIIAIGDGLLAPSVPSAQTRFVLPSKVRCSGDIGTGAPMPYYPWLVINAWVKCITSHIIQSIQKQLCGREEGTVKNGQDEATYNG